MEITVTQAGPCRKTMSVVVAEADVSAAFEKAFHALRQQVAIPGFRPGKTPRQVIEKRYGEQVRMEVAEELIQKAIDEGVKTHALEIVSQPELETKNVMVESGAPFAFTLAVDVKPVFDLPDYKGIKVERRIEAVTDANVDRVVEDIRKRKGTMEDVTEGYAAGDAIDVRADVVVDGSVVASGVTFNAHGDPPHVHDFAFADFVGTFAGRKAGDAVVTPATVAEAGGHGHDDHHGHGHDLPAHKLPTGSAVELRATVESVRRLALPPVDDDLAKAFNFATVLELRLDIRKKLESAHKAKADSAVEDAILQRLTEMASFDVAAGPINRALDERMRRLVLEHRHSHREADESSAIAAVEKERDGIRQTVERDTRAWFLVEKIAKKEKIFALEDDVSKAIERIARENDATPGEVRTYYMEKGLLPELRAEIVERKVRDFLRTHATITEAAAKEADSSAQG